jgi:hypothetical protein
MMKRHRLCTLVFVLTLILPTSAFALFLGPYSGQVIDSHTGEPLQGACVLIYWEKWVFDPMGGHDRMIKATLVYTDQNGIYQIPMTYAYLGLLSTGPWTNVIIYQPGYEAYIARHDNEGSFRAIENVIKLDRIPPHFDHGKHYGDISRAMDGMDYPGLVSTPDGHRATGEMFGEEHLSSVRIRNVLLGRAEWENRSK